MCARRHRSGDRLQRYGRPRPLLYLTFGTVINDNEVFRAALAGTRGLGVLAALGMGIPQLCLPQAADQFINAAAVARAGAGLAIPPHEVDPNAVADAVRRLLDDSAFGRHARLVADDIAAMPSPDEVAGVLETLA
jgi:UDP:flavonoid glycosyltransferase YjiC (YdhE family)